MGCADSKAVQTTNGYEKKQSPTSKSSTPTKEKNVVTVKEFFDSFLTLPPTQGHPYVQPSLPDFYVEQNVSFENENIDSKVWDTEINVTEKKKHNQKGNNRKQNNESETTWHYRKPPNRKYVEPEDSRTVDIEYEQGAKKKCVVVIGGLYLGSTAACKQDVLKDIDVESTHSLVILGNLFDMLSVDPFHQIPTDVTKIESMIAESEPVLASIRRLAEEMDVYYMLGSHDSDLTRVGMERLLGDRVIYVQQEHLILSVKAANESYRVCLTPGRQWDFLHNRKLSPDKLLSGKPIGHYLCRASVDNSTYSSSSLFKPIASVLPAELSADFLKQISRKPLQDKITARMLLSAFQLSSQEELINIKCVTDEGKYISANSILEYPYIKYLAEELGEPKLIAMLKAMIGDFSSIAKGLYEDIFITGLGDKAELSKVTTESGQDIICASTGSCSQRSSKLTMLKILYPKQGSNGKVEIIECLTDSPPQQNGGRTMTSPAEVEDDKADALSVESL